MAHSTVRTAVEQTTKIMKKKKEEMNISPFFI